MRRSMIVACSLLGISGILPAQDGADAPKEPPKVALIDLKNEVEGTATILKLAPEGTWVTKGQALATLDSATLRDQLVDQEILTQKASANLEYAKLELATSELAQKIATESDYPAKLADLKRAQQLAEDELSLRDEELTAIESLEAATPLGRHQAKFRKAQAELANMRLREELESLQSVRKTAEWMKHDSILAAARAKFITAKATFELQKAKQEKLLRQIRKCQLDAPTDGILIHPGPSGDDSPVEVGAKVREGQILLKVAQVRVE